MPGVWNEWLFMYNSVLMVLCVLSLAPGVALLVAGIGCM
jgi:hypothetical protein